MADRILSLLAELGFNGVEAAAYVALLKEPGATGYRLSRVIGKPVPNTYKALDSLRRKGAAIMDDSGGSRTYAALSIHEYLDGVHRNMESKQEQIEHELRNVVATPMESGIYQLNSAEQVYERARTLLAEAKSVVLVDAFLKPLGNLTADLTKAAKRGVRVLVLSYGPFEVESCEVIAPRKEVPSVGAWDGDWLNISADCTEYMYALIKKDGTGVHRAVWGRDTYLGLMVFSGMLNEMVLRRVFQLLHFGKTREEIHQEVERMSKRYVSESPYDRVIAPWRRDEEKRMAPAAAARRGLRAKGTGKTTDKES